MDAERALAIVAEAERSERLAASPLVERLAVLATFDPERLDADDARDVVGLLCRALPARDHRREALLTDDRRIDALAALLARGGKPALAAVRRSVVPHFDTPLQRMLDAFVLGPEIPVAERDEDDLLASLEVWRWATEAVARAGLTVGISTGPTRDEIESRLALLNVTRAVAELDAAGCVGREAELAQLDAYRRAPGNDRGLSENPAMVVHGIGGVGKSTLVARFVMDLYREGQHGEPRAWAYLDLDRPSLSSYRPEVLLEDIIRQVGAQFPERRRAVERSELVVKQRSAGAGLEAADAVNTYYERASDFAAWLPQFTDGSLTVVLDTYEELERNQPWMADEVYRLFAALAGALPDFKLIVSGRGPAKAFLGEAADRQLALLPLEDAAALELLRFFVGKEAEAIGSPATLDDALGAQIIGLVGGIPLTVRLAARVLVHEGATAITDAARRAHALDRVRSEFVRGFLYQRILDHITVPDEAETRALREVARASIVLRRVTVELIEQVLLPALEDPPTLPAARLFDGLAREVALAELHDDVLRLREELRGPALAALKYEAPHLVGHVHERAAAYYASLDADETSVLELTYHRLAKGDPVATVAAGVDEHVLRRLAPSLADLPPASAQAVRRALADPGELSRSRSLVGWEQKTLPEADAAIRASDLERARALLSARGERSAGTELHRLESRLEQAAGNLPGAIAASERDLAAAEAAADATRYAAAAVRLAMLHELAAAPAAATAVLAAAADAPLLAGHHVLRLELLLNRMNLQERGGLETEESRWSLGLDARVLLHHGDPRVIAANRALPRLLAAALGRDEPERIELAVRAVGLGREEDRRRVLDLVAALAAWDLEQTPPGRLARQLQLRVESDQPEAIERAWTAGVSGLGTDVGLLLGRLWSVEPPPQPVLEATRQIYLWWGVVTADDEPSQPRRPHFLDEQPIDWSRDEILALEELVLTAYPTSTEARALADRAGLDPERFSWWSSDRRITRELLGVASRMGRLGDLVQAILLDRAAVSVHDPLRSLVGDAWLQAHGSTATRPLQST